MNENQATPGRQQFTVHGDIISAGPDSQVNYAKGKNIYQSNVGAPSGAEIRNAREALGAELARIRQRLEDDDGRMAGDDRDDALDAVAGIQDVVRDTETDGADSQRKLKRRIRELIGVLAPVAEIIGGVAALEAIVQHL